MAFRKLTPARRKKLESLSADWREEAHDWKAGRLFLDLEAEGLCEMQDRRVKGGDVTTGPGNTSVYRWFTRRTQAGTNALVENFNATTIERTARATR